MNSQQVRTILNSIYWMPSKKIPIQYVDAMNPAQRFVKRTFDVIASAVGMILLSPAYLAIYVALKTREKSPIIFKQERIGYKGKPFYIYKFRTMRLDAELDGPRLASGEDDERLTKIGKFLREHHLDELPQLWNVFIGDMSMVGPRPERKFFIEKIMERDPRYVHIYKMRPGVTSEATLYNGYTSTVEKMLERLEMDLNYLRTRSLWGDLVILIKTTTSIINGKKF